MRTNIQKWGNSLAIRIPKAFANEIHLTQGTPIDMTVIEDKLQITPIQEPELSLEQLLNEVTEANIHQEVDTGSPIGKEI